MTKEELLAVTVDPAKLDYKNPIFERLEEDPNNPWVLEDQIRFFKKCGVPIAYFAFKGQKSRHYYAVYEGKSKTHANDVNKMNNRDTKKSDRKSMVIKEHETDSYEVMVDNGYDAPREDDNPEEIVAYKIVMDALTKEYESLSEEKKRICDTISEGMTQRAAADMLGIPRRTYRDSKDKTLGDLAKKMKKYK